MGCGFENHGFKPFTHPVGCVTSTCCKPGTQQRIRDGVMKETWPVLAFISSVQFSSVAQLCPTLWDPMDRSTPGLPVHHQLLEFIQTHVHWIADAMQPSYPLSSPSPPAPNPSQSKGLARIFSNTTVQKYQFFDSQLSLQSNSHIHTWLLEKP